MRFGTFESSDQEPLGVGDNKETFINPTDQEKVISVLKERNTPRTLKGSFYLTKIAHQLLPHRVPEIYQAGESVDGQQTFDRERIAHTPGHELLQTDRQAGRDTAGRDTAGRDTEEARTRMIEEMGAEMGEVDLELERIGLSFNIDSNVANYTKDEKGNVYYLETFTPWGVDPARPHELELLFDKGELVEAIGQLPDQNTRETCEAELERILALFEEEKKEFAEVERARLKDCESGIKDLEALFAAFEAKHDLEALLTIQTQEMALSSEERKSAKSDLPLILSQLNALGNDTNITKERYAELCERYNTLSRAVGFINSGQVSHER